MQAGERFIPMGIFKGIFIPNCIKSHKILNANDKLVWGQLNYHAGTNGACYPKQIVIAEELGISERTVRTSIQNLIDNKFIAIEEPTGKRRRMHFSTQYYFIWNETYEIGIRPNIPEAPRPEIVAGLQAAKVAGANKGRIKEEKEPPLPPKTFLLESEDQPKLPFRPIRSSILFLNMFPKQYHTNSDFQSIWKMYIEYRGEDKKRPLTERAVKLMLSEITSNPTLSIPDAIERIQWCITNCKIAPNFKPFKNKQTSSVLPPTTRPVGYEPQCKLKAGIQFNH